MWMMQTDPPAHIETVNDPLLDWEAAAPGLWTSLDLDERLPRPSLKTEELPHFHWMKSAWEEDLPKNPFPKESPAWKEAEALLGFLNAPASEQLKQLPNLELELDGSSLALWRWGVKKMRSQQKLTSPLRFAWEDRLMTLGQPPILRGWAFRHALCWALAEKDEKRFSELRFRFPDPQGGSAELLPAFQSAFGMLGGSLPLLRLWKLPEGKWVEISLGSLGLKQIWLGGLETLDRAPEGAGLLVVSLEDHFLTIHDQEGPQGYDFEQCRQALNQKKLSGYFVPESGPLRKLALVYFPILLEFGSKGELLGIQMGDAAPRRPL